MCTCQHSPNSKWLTKYTKILWICIQWSINGRWIDSLSGDLVIWFFHFVIDGLFVSIVLPMDFMRWLLLHSFLRGFWNDPSFFFLPRSTTRWFMSDRPVRDLLIHGWVFWRAPMNFRILFINFFRSYRSMNNPFSTVFPTFEHRQRPPGGGSTSHPRRSRIGGRGGLRSGGTLLPRAHTRQKVGPSFIRWCLGNHDTSRACFWLTWKVRRRWMFRRTVPPAPFVVLSTPPDDRTQRHSLFVIFFILLQQARQLTTMAGMQKTIGSEKIARP